MGRKKLYDESQALEKAMYLFWRNGYGAVKTRDLANEMGINQYSLYASFESKELLFVKALDHYLETIVCDWLIKPLIDQGDGKKAITQFFETFVEPSTGTYPLGCLVCNTMVEKQRHNSDVRSVIERYQSLLRDAFAGALHRIHRDSSAQDISCKAELLLCLTLGIAVKKRNGFEGAPVQGVVDQIVGSIVTVA